MIVNEERTATILLELRRIGVNFDALSEPLVGTGLRASELVRVAPRIPDDAGADELLRRLEEQARVTRPPVEYRWRRERPWPTSLGRRERWWPTQALLDAGVDLLLEEWDPFGIRLAGADREAIAMFTFHFFGPLLESDGRMDPIEHVAGMIASAERDHLALRPSPEPHRRYLARRLRQLAEEYPVPKPEYLPPQAMVVVQLGEDVGPPPLDPEGVCARCHSFGTVARVTTMSVPPRSARYCAACWADVHTEYAGFGRHPKIPETAAEHIAFHDSMHRPPTATFSRSWIDTIDQIRAMTEHISHLDEHAAATQTKGLTEYAVAIAKVEDKMDGPMPPEVATFVQRYSSPDA